MELFSQDLAISHGSGDSIDNVALQDAHTKITFYRDFPIFLSGDGCTYIGLPHLSSPSLAVVRFSHWKILGKSRIYINNRKKWKVERDTLRIEGKHLSVDVLLFDQMELLVFFKFNFHLFLVVTKYCRFFY